MRKKRVWNIYPMLIITSVILILFGLLSLMWDYRIAVCELAAAVLVVIALLIRFRSIRKDIHAVILKAIEDFSRKISSRLTIFLCLSLLQAAAGRLSGITICSEIW